MKFPNKEYEMVLRAGTFIDKDNLRREHEAAWVLTWAVCATLMVCLLAVIFQSCGMAGGVR